VEATTGQGFIRMLASCKEIMSWQKMSLFHQTSVFDFFKISSGTRTSPPGMSDIEYGHPAGQAYSSSGNTSSFLCLVYQISLFFSVSMNASWRKKSLELSSSFWHSLCGKICLDLRRQSRTYYDVTSRDDYVSGACFRQDTEYRSQSLPLPVFANFFNGHVFMSDFIAWN
jgi:hypothetical protein